MNSSLAIFYATLEHTDEYIIDINLNVNLKTLSKEEELIMVERAKNDPQAFGELYEMYYQKILNYALRRSQNIHLAEDITSEVFFVVLKNIDKFKIIKGSNFNAWIYKIATNVFYNSGRRRFKYRKYWDNLGCDNGLNEAVENEAEEIERNIDEQKITQRLGEYIKSFPPKIQSLIYLKFFEDLSYDDISYICGVKVNTLKSQMKRAIERLRHLLNINDSDHGEE